MISDFRLKRSPKRWRESPIWTQSPITDASGCAPVSPVRINQSTSQRVDKSIRAFLHSLIPTFTLRQAQGDGVTRAHCLSFILSFAPSHLPWGLIPMTGPEPGAPGLRVRINQSTSQRVDKSLRAFLHSLIPSFPHSLIPSPSPRTSHSPASSSTRDRA